jgi:hypothetical protein
MEISAITLVFNHLFVAKLVPPYNKKVLFRRTKLSLENLSYAGITQIR